MTWMVWFYICIAFGFFLDPAGDKRKELVSLSKRKLFFIKFTTCLLWPAALGSLLSQINIYMDRYQDDTEKDWTSKK